MLPPSVMSVGASVLLSTRLAACSEVLGLYIARRDLKRDPAHAGQIIFRPRMGVRLIQFKRLLPRGRILSGEVVALGIARRDAFLAPNLFPRPCLNLVMCSTTRDFSHCQIIFYRNLERFQEKFRHPAGKKLTSGHIENVQTRSSLAPWFKS